MPVKVLIEVKEIRGLGYCKKLVVGQKWTYPDDVSGLCPFALNSLLPALFILQFEGRHPQSNYTGSEDSVVECCPDAMRPVVFLPTRIREEQPSAAEEDATVYHPYIA